MPAPRLRPHVMLTLDPAIRDEAKRLATAAGLPLSRWLEMLVRAELDKERRRASR